MELLPSVKLKNGRISLSNHLIFPTRSVGKSVFKRESYPISLNSSQLEKRGRLALRSSYDEDGSIAQQGLESLPLSLELELISDESKFDRVVAEAQLEEPVVILWLASWCRKCIYLKPKLEKLAADYYPRIRFYSVDVNKVPHKLVVRAGITKMPTIQLWRNGKKEAEVIGGQKAYLVVNEVRDMIENEDIV